MQAQLKILFCLIVMIIGIGLCDLSLLTIDIPARLQAEEQFDPQAPDPGTNGVEIPPDPDMQDAPDAEEVAAAEATPTPTPTATLVVQQSPTPGPTPTASPTPQPTATPTLPALRETLNIILLGSDHRGNARDWRTDTMIVVMIDPNTRQAGAISIPRDLWVAIPGRPPNRVNTLDEFGGPPLVKKVIGAALDIPIDYYVRVEFDGFVKGVDAIGGITVNVDCTLRDGKAFFPKGPTQMDGTTALTFARSRATTSVWDRMRRQSQVLWAAREKMLSVDMFPRIPAIWNAVSGYVQTDVPATTILALAGLAREIKPADIHGMTIDYTMSRHITSPQGWWILQPDFNKIRAGVRNIFSAAPLTEAMAKPATCKG